MKKLIYFLMLATVMSLAFTSCKEKEDDDEDDDIDLTYVITGDYFA